MRRIGYLTLAAAAVFAVAIVAAATKSTVARPAMSALPNSARSERGDDGIAPAARLLQPPYAVSAGAVSLRGRAAILAEADSGTILYSKNASREIAPASLTKLVTIYTAMQLSARGELDLKQRITPPPVSWARNMPAGSSLMFLGPNQQLSVYDLLKGLAVPSGNDAAVALSLHTSGSVEAFAELMNREMALLGLSKLRFVEPSGLSPQNAITARQFAAFIRAYLDEYPENLRRFHDEREMRYPTAENYPSGAVVGTSVVQQNRNGLLWDYPGADGLKTGYIEESGYNIAVTAERDGMRLIAVILGVAPSEDRSGSELREADARRLLDYGFENFERLELTLPELRPIRVWYGSDNEVALEVTQDQAVIAAPQAEGAAVTAHVNVPDALVAPVAAGREVGELLIERAGAHVRTLPIVAAGSVAEAGPVKMVWDSVAQPMQEALQALGATKRR